MEVNQIYDLVNSVTNQALGSSDLTVVDETSLVALGEQVLSSSTNTEPWLNTLAQRIGRTIISFRKYNSKFSNLVLDNVEWGAVVQKIKVSMPSATEDDAYNLLDGKSIDMYKVAKPKVSQKLFVSETPYKFYVTVQEELLKEAFTGNSQMASFIGAVYGEVQNKIELTLETLGRNAINNYIGCIASTDRAINLLAEYNSETNAGLTVANCMHDNNFINYSVGRIKYYSKLFTDMTSIFNDGSETRHTPLEMQQLYVMSDFITRAETVSQYQAFHDRFVSLNGYKELNFLQSIKTPSTIKVIPSNAEPSDDETGEVTVSGIIGVLFDRDALGIFKKQEIVRTTPFNASGLYSNTYYHLKELYFNDLSENFVFFYIADA